MAAIEADGIRPQAGGQPFDVQVAAGGSSPVVVALRVEDVSGNTGVAPVPIAAGGWTQFGPTIPFLMSEGVDVSNVNAIAVVLVLTSSTCTTVYLDNLRLTICEDPPPEITVVKTQSPVSPGTGQAVTYQIVVSNVGSATIEVLEIVDTVSPVVTMVTTDQPAVFAPPTVSQVLTGTRYVWSGAGEPHNPPPLTLDPTVLLNPDQVSKGSRVGIGAVPGQYPAIDQIG